MRFESLGQNSSRGGRGTPDVMWIKVTGSGFIQAAVQQVLALPVRYQTCRGTVYMQGGSKLTSTSG